MGEWILNHVSGTVAGEVNQFVPENGLQFILILKYDIL